MSRLRPLAVIAAVVCATSVAAPAAAAAEPRVRMEISRVSIRTERAHPAVPTLRAVVTVCVRNRSTTRHRFAPTVRSNFLLSPRKGEGDNARWGYTIPFEIDATFEREHCRRRNVAGVAEDVERRLRITTERSDGVGWTGPHKVGAGHGT